MKTLYLIRHAKSDWGSPAVPDNERPLNSRGKRDAGTMGNMMAERGWTADRWLVSTARRAEETAHLICRLLHYQDVDICRCPKLYLASPESILRELIKAGDANSAIIVAHNPGISELAIQLGLSRSDYLPTCGVVAFQLDISRWLDLQQGNINATVLGFETPATVAAKIS